MFLLCQQNCGILKSSNYFRRAHKGDFPKFGHICIYVNFTCNLSQICKINSTKIRMHLLSFEFTLSNYFVAREGCKDIDVAKVK